MITLRCEMAGVRFTKQHGVSHDSFAIQSVQPKPPEPPSTSPTPTKPAAAEPKAAKPAPATPTPTVRPARQANPYFGQMTA